MKTLLILRHGKSSWDEPVDDHERPLKGRGKKAAVRMGQEIRARDLMPELILSSTAKRARKTARRAARSAGYEGDIVETGALYFTGVEGHLESLAQVSDVHQRIMIVGHNPNLENLVQELTGEEVVLPTAALAGIELEVDSWSAIADSSGKLQFLLLPRELEAGKE